MSIVGFKRPSLETLRRQTEADIAANLPQIDNLLPGTPLWAIQRALAGAVHIMHGRIDYAADQTNLLYAEDEYLDQWGVHWGITRKQATLATGTVTVTGTNGATIPTGTELRTTDTGIVYETTASVTIAGGTATLPVEATEYGDAGNLVAGVSLGFVSPVAGIASRATVVAIDGGADIEGNTAYRKRILARIHQAPHGGSAQDYVTWALEVPGVTRAWVYPNEAGSGTVVVRFMMDESYPNGVPLSGDVADVLAYIEARRPITAEVFVYAPVPAAINVTVTALTPDNPEVRASATAELREMIKREGSPGGALYQSWFWEAVSQATGCRHHIITTPAANVATASGQIPVLGTVTFA